MSLLKCGDFIYDLGFFLLCSYRNMTNWKSSRPFLQWWWSS